MSYWSSDGKKVLRSRSRGPSGEEADMSAPIRQTRSMVRRNPSPENRFPVARNPELVHELPVSRNPELVHELPVSRNPEFDHDLPVAPNPDARQTESTVVLKNLVEVETVDVEVPDEQSIPGNESLTAVDVKSTSESEQVPNESGSDGPAPGAPISKSIESEDIPSQGNETNTNKINPEVSTGADGDAAASQLPQSSQAPMDIQPSSNSEGCEGNSGDRQKPEPVLEGNDDYGSVSTLTRSGTPIPMEFVPFGDAISRSEADELRHETNDIPHLARRRFTRKPPYTLGEPYPIPQLRPRYWKPSAAEAVCDGTNGRKRKSYRSNHNGKKPKMAPTSATSVLNEKYPGLEYTFSDPVGPPHSLTFTVTVSFAPLGRDFSATGSSKKNAKNNIAQLILSRLGIDVPLPQKRMPEDSDFTELATAAPVVDNQQSSAPVVAHVPPLLVSGQKNNPVPVQTPYMEIDFAADDILEVCAQPPPPPPMVMVQQQTKQIPNNAQRIRNIPNLEENAVLALTLLIQPQKAVFNFVSEEGQPHEKIFTTEMQLVENSQVQSSYIGRAQSKKKSKANAAIQALAEILNPEVFGMLVQRSNVLGRRIALNSGSQNNENLPMEFERQDTAMHDLQNEPFGDQFNQPFANHVRSIVMDKYEDLVKEQEYIPQKVIAGVVMTWAIPFIEHSTVLAVTTGTKCIEGDFMSTGGLALNDCHAEVLATRCLRDYFFSQLEEFRSGELLQENCIFERHPEQNGIDQYRLKEGIQFHLYISTSPCGDARIFSPKGLECEEDESLEAPGDEIIDSHPNRANRGVLRSKIEAGEGTIPVANLDPGPQTWDAIMQGSALRTMSCSDKVCRWNVVGFQGALLSQITGPIYYSSIVLGSLHHPIHFERAVYGRIEKLSDQLQLPYILNRPKLLMISDGSKRQVKKSPNHAVLWAANWGGAEIVAASKGKCLGPEVASRVAKRLQFIRFLRVYKNPDGRRENYANLYYADAKMSASEYQNALNQMKDCFKKSGLGSWISKPMEQDSFGVSNK